MDNLKGLLSIWQFSGSYVKENDQFFLKNTETCISYLKTKNIRVKSHHYIVNKMTISVIKILGIYLLHPYNFIYTHTYICNKYYSNYSLNL